MTWRDLAACHGHDHGLFFDPDRQREALAICRDCPVSGDCLADALDRDERGVWGGTTEGQRHQIRRRTPRPCGICGRPVTPTGKPGAQRRYCGPDCANQAVERTRAEWNDRRRRNRAS